MTDRHRRITRARLTAFLNDLEALFRKHDLGISEAWGSWEYDSGLMVEPLDDSDALHWIATQRRSILPKPRTPEEKRQRWLARRPPVVSETPEEVRALLIQYNAENPDDQLPLPGDAVLVRDPPPQITAENAGFIHPVQRVRVVTKI